MMKKMYLPMLMGVLLVGCGGGGSGVLETGDTITGTQSVPTIASNFKIDTANVEDYDINDPIEDQYLAVINHFRGLRIKCNDSHAMSGPSSSDMQWNIFLADAAAEHSEDMRIAEHYAHNGSGIASDITGQTFTPARASKPFERIVHNGFTGSSAENIAVYGSTLNPADSDKWVTIMEKWMTSTAGHCSNIMNPDLTEFGMFESRADINATGWYKVYWTQNFGKPQ